jgi:ABC-type Fe3+/spermidine/putrescine transport system ATPase subunit
MALRLSDLTYSYKGGEKVLKGLSLEVSDGEIATLLGRSGSGKTTVLNLIAGFLRPDSGRIEIDSKEISRLMPGKRGIGMVMQDLALFPNMTALQNVEYGLKAQGIPSREAMKRSSEILEGMGMAPLKDRSVLQLSGGERQRVALARSLVYRPKLLLMDEPLSALDPSLREGLRREVKRVLHDSGTTTLYVTHDRTEALSISDRVHIIDGGRIIESGHPRDIYRRPRTVKGAAFMGVSTPIPAISKGDDNLMTPFGNVRSRGESPGFFGYRPENVEWSDPGDALKIRGKVVSCEFRGRDYNIEVRTDDGIFSGLSERPIPVESIVSMFIKKGDLFVLR